MPHLATSARLATLLALGLIVRVATPDYAAAEKKREAPPAKPANQYAAFDAHPKEHVTIAAEPCDKPSDCSFFRLEYIQHGFLPVRVIVTNDGDQPISLDEARIQFISADNDVIPAATDEDLNRRLFSTKSVHGTKIPLPAPLPPITIHHAPVDKKITEDDNDFGFPTTIVKPHTTVSGYLFYDIRALDDPALKNAELYVKEVYTGDHDAGPAIPAASSPQSAQQSARQPTAKPSTRASDQPAPRQLFAFSIPFNKWLAEHPATKSTN